MDVRVVFDVVVVTIGIILGGNRIDKKRIFGLWNYITMKGTNLEIRL